MAKLLVVLPDDLLIDLRTTLAAIGRGKKGELSKAVEEAIRLWLDIEKRKLAGVTGLYTE
jgi:hypothetical protein